MWSIIITLYHTLLSDLLFEWLYKNDSLKALGEAGYFDDDWVAGQYDIYATVVIEDSDSIDSTEEALMNSEEDLPKVRPGSKYWDLLCFIITKNKKSIK